MLYALVYIVMITTRFHITESYFLNKDYDDLLEVGMITPEEVAAVRKETFRTQLGGYDEKQVDVLLDDTISVMLAVR